MKTLIPASIFFMLLCLISCKQSNEHQVIGEQADTVAVQSNECYLAVYESDTVNLKLNRLNDNTITGDMQMKISGEPVKIGSIAGSFRGDTLFADYTFILGENKGRTFKNPIALLKKDSLLIFGNGKIETNMGASYFSKSTPIDFDRIKYKFSPVDCTK